MSQVREYLEGHLQDMLSDVEKLVRAESPSNCKALVDACGQVVQHLFAEHLSVSAQVFTQTEAGDHLRFEYGAGERQILLIGHFDTVWDKGRLPYRIEGDRAYGPGIFDMKAGIVQAAWAVKAIRELHLPLRHRLVFFLNSDEEPGSDTSRALIENEASRSLAALVLEPSVAKSGALKTARKGVGICQVEVSGIASHAGNHHELGVSAIEEMAHQILAMQRLTDYASGSTVNVGVVEGGTRSNVVADYARAEVDFRMATQSEGERILQAVYGLTPKLQGTRISVSGGVNRPPMERSLGTLQLFETAKRVAKEELDVVLEEMAVGGGSDGNFAAAMGIPVLDGLGAVGDGPHAENEHIDIAQLPVRAALLAHLLLAL